MKPEVRSSWLWLWVGFLMTGTCWGLSGMLFGYAGIAPAPPLEGAGIALGIFFGIAGFILGVSAVASAVEAWPEEPKRRREE